MKISAGLRDDFETNWFIEESSLNDLDAVEPAPEFGLTAENNYRIFGEAPLIPQNDKGWQKLQNELLLQPMLNGAVVSYTEYKDWMKNGTKLTKYLNSVLLVNVLREYGQYDLNFKHDLFNKYFKRYVEDISSFRAGCKNSNMKIMLTANPEDMILCSAHGTFSSCMSLTSPYGQWRAIPACIWNPNIAMLVMVDGDLTTRFKLNNGHTIEVPRVLARTWVYLFKTNTDNKVLATPRQFPNSFVTDTELNKHFPIPKTKWQSNGGVVTPYYAKFPVMRYKNYSRVILQPYFDKGYKIVNFTTETLEYRIQTSGGTARYSRALNPDCESMDFYENGFSVEGSYV